MAELILDKKDSNWSSKNELAGAIVTGHHPGPVMSPSAHEASLFRDAGLSK